MLRSLATSDLCSALTPREREVLDWLAGGKTDRDIGGILGISPRTVHKHLQRVYEKLGVETRTAAVARVFLYQPTGIGQSRTAPIMRMRVDSTTVVAPSAVTAAK